MPTREVERRHENPLIWIWEMFTCVHFFFLLGDFGDLLIYGDSVAVSGTNFPPGQENINTVVMMTNASRVVKAADRRNGITMFFQRFEGTGSD